MMKSPACGILLSGILPSGTVMVHPMNILTQDCNIQVTAFHTQLSCGVSCCHVSIRCVTKLHDMGLRM